ncbi:MAG: hypothetical protein K8R79_10315, partial [Calditrichales bacterium]|nr:hypothetical protein [Calditrichales bacterium]
LTTLQNKMDDMAKKVFDATTNAHSKLDEIQNIDKELVYEIKGRMENLFESVQKPSKEYFSFFNETNAQILFLISQKAFIYSESELLKQLMLSWKNQSNELKIKKSSFFDKSESILEPIKEQIKQSIENENIK